MEIARKSRNSHIYLVQSFSSTGRKFLLYKKDLDGKSLSKFYGLGLEEFLYFLLNITV